MEEKNAAPRQGGGRKGEVDGDGLFLRQALVNILHNAVKYSPIGKPIHVRVHNGHPDNLR